MNKPTSSGSCYPSTGETRGRGRPPVPAIKVEMFLTALAGLHHIGRAAEAAGVDRSALYDLRARDPDFAARWTAAMDGLPGRVADAVIETAIEGTPVLNEEGKVVGRRRDSKLLERLAETHGVLASRRPEVALQINNQSAPAPAVNEQALEAELMRRLWLLPAPVASGEVAEHEPVPEDDGSDLVGDL